MTHKLTRRQVLKLAARRRAAGVAGVRFAERGRVERGPRPMAARAGDHPIIGPRRRSAGRRDLCFPRLAAHQAARQVKVVAFAPDESGCLLAKSPHRPRTRHQRD